MISSPFEIVLYSDPVPQSRAEYILLRNTLLQQDELFIKIIGEWQKFREAYLREVLEKEGDLVCTYCHRRHLEIGEFDLGYLHKNQHNKNLATVDHIVPLAGGGEKYNKENLTVACSACNTKKSTRSYDEFMEYRKQLREQNDKINNYGRS